MGSNLLMPPRHHWVGVRGATRFLVPHSTVQVFLLQQNLTVPQLSGELVFHALKAK